MNRCKYRGIAIGCNAVPNACAWSKEGVIAYAAHHSVAVFNPANTFGTEATLNGHTDRVTVVRWLDHDLIISGAADNTLRIWRYTSLRWKCLQVITDHKKTISSIAVLDQFVVSASLDGSINLYRYENELNLVCSVQYSPLIPLTVAIARLPGTSQTVMAVGGTSPHVNLYAIDLKRTCFVAKAKLVGHEDWIKALDFFTDGDSLLLASASQDRYIRLWRIDHRTENLDLSTLSLLENKAHDFDVPDERAPKWKAAFEALLVGHEDWIYSVHFSRTAEGHPILLSASADSSIILWRADADSQIWVVHAQLGTISTKGASTATGSTGGFWGALFAPESTSHTICAWNRTGAIRLWKSEDLQQWRSIAGIGGHTKQVRSLSWSPGGEYLLTTSLDQSTRLWAQYKGDWLEFARPQIHGYDIQAIHVVSSTLFLSGAEEKIVRVFRATSSVVSLLSRIAGIEFPQNHETVEAANVPALGLSNKALSSADQGTHLGRADLDDEADGSVKAPMSKLMLDTLVVPPIEDHLQRHTLFPEVEKLYGHGYEIQALSATHDGSLIVSGCRATTPDHAVLRLYDAAYKEIAQLPGHTLTVTKARLSANDEYLLSVSRDRSLCLYKRTDNGYAMYRRQSKAHKRIIWDCAWLSESVFVTASRDASCIIWRITDTIEKITTIDIASGATAVAYCNACLAIGTETGSIYIYHMDEAHKPELLETFQDCAGSITGVAFRPSDPSVLAFTSEDCSVRIIQIAS